VAEPDELCRYLVPQPLAGEARADIIVAHAGAQPQVTMLDTEEYLPWAGHSARHALGEIYDLIKRHKTTLVFVNTRSQVEFTFQELWRMNADNLAIALHHGSLDIKRLGDMLSRIKGRIGHKALGHVSPLAIPVMLEIGRETVYGEAADSLLAEAADELVKEAMR
jgi:Lhr-like helicase